MAAIDNGETTKNFYYIDIFLTQTYKNLGQYDIIRNNEFFGELIEFNFETQSELLPIEYSEPFSISITGETQNDFLKKIIAYNGQYKVGVNDVTQVNENFVRYTINDINYITYFNNNLTIYGVEKITNELEYQNILKDDNSVSVDVKKTLNAFVIDRLNIPVYDYFNKINNCTNLDDLLDIF